MKLGHDDGVVCAELEEFSLHIVRLEFGKADVIKVVRSLQGLLKLGLWKGP